jgi:MFS family permease
MMKRAAVLLKTEPEVIALSFARMADALGNSLLIIIIPLYIAAQPSHLFPLPTELLVGIAISLYGFVFALSQPFWGYASDRVRRRKPFILGGLFLMMAATLGFILADRYLWIIVLRGLQGIGVAMIIPSVLALISQVTVKRSRGNAMGVYSTFRMVGFATGPLLAGILHVKFGFNATFVVGAAFLVVAMILVQTTVKEEVGGVGGPAGLAMRMELTVGAGLMACGNPAPGAMQWLHRTPTARRRGLPRVQEGSSSPRPPSWDSWSRPSSWPVRCP